MRARFVEGLARSIRGWLSGDQAGYQDEWDGRLGPTLGDVKVCNFFSFMCQLPHMNQSASTAR
jgi:hypothetical protein